MVNPDFDQFIKEQKEHKSIYPGHEDHGPVKRDYKDNKRGNTDKNVGATGRDID